MITIPRYARLFTALAFGALATLSNITATIYWQTFIQFGTDGTLTKHIDFTVLTTVLATLATLSLLWVFTPQRLK